jgi:glutamine synthetase
MALNCKTPQDVMAAISENGILIVDVKFTDLYGQWHHYSMPVERFDADSAFEEGMGFDGSSIRGFKSIESSDMNLIADPTTAIIDPVCAMPTLSLVCNVVDTINGEKFSRDPRNVAQKSVEYVKSTGIADTVYIGPEAEFFIFDEVYYHTGQYSSAYGVDSMEAPWNMGVPGTGHQIGYKGGYFPVSPMDALQDIRSEMVRTMIDAGIDVEVHHHEVATAGQCEIDMRYSPLVKMADQVQLYKYITKNVAKKYGKTVTFMPKPLFQDNGSGMHTHQSLWKDGQPLFAGDKYAGLSQMALWYIGGILKHINSLLAFCAPTTNSYRRLVPGYEAPVVVAYSARNRSAACRIPTYSKSPKAIRVEFRCPDPAANPYLAFSAMLMAGLDGIKNQIDPGNPSEMDLFEEETLKHVKTVKGSLDAVLDELEADNAYLLEGGVFTSDLIETYVATKRVADVDAVRLRPHPHEYVMYYGI